VINQQQPTPQPRREKEQSMNPTIDPEQAVRKAEGYSDWHFQRVPDSKGLPSDADWYLSDCVNGDWTVKHITSAIKDDIIDVFKAAGNRPDEIKWNEDTGTLVLYGVWSINWFGDWAERGRSGIEDYLYWLGDPRFPDLDRIYEKTMDGDVDLFCRDDDEVVRQFLQVDPVLDEQWVRRALPRLRERNEDNMGF
jgi:hypothetical protein